MRGAPSDHSNRGALVVAGLASSTVLSSVIGAAVLSATDWDTTSPAGAGAYVGRVGAQQLVLEVDPSPLGVPIWAVVLLQVPLWACLLGAVWLASGRSRAGVRDQFGFWAQPRDPVIGLPIGVVAQVVLVPLLYLPIIWLLGDRDLSGPARALTDRADSLLGIALLVLGVGLIAPIVEELFFRGLLLRTLESRVAPVGALVASSVIFGAIHFQLLQFPALMLFGLIAGTLAQRFGRLGPAIWAHIGFNLVTVVVLVGFA